MKHEVIFKAAIEIAMREYERRLDKLVKSGGSINEKALESIADHAWFDALPFYNSMCKTHDVG